MRSILMWMALVSMAATAEAQTPAPTIEQLEAQIAAAEAKQAQAAKAARMAQALRAAEAARKSEVERQARVKREAQAQAQRDAEAAAALAARQAILIIQSDTRCELSINGEAHGWLEADANQRLEVNPGAQLIECAGDGRQVEQTANVESGKQAVVQLALPAPEPERFERVAEGVRDNAQNLIWAASDNGSDINWTKAGAYCASKGAGWTLPTVAALQSLYDKSGKYLQSFTYSAGTYTIKPATPLISLSGGTFWSNEQNGASEAWYVYLGGGDRYARAIGYAYYIQVLCVRRS